MPPVVETSASRGARPRRPLPRVRPFPDPAARLRARCARARGWGGRAPPPPGRPRAAAHAPGGLCPVSAPSLTRPTAFRPADPDAGLPAGAYGKEKGHLEQLVLYVFVVVPFVGLAAVVPVVWGWGLSWLDVALFAAFYFVPLLGVTVGYHRYFTHGSFKARRPLRIALAIAGCMAIQGPVVQWVADHRRHHAFSDREGDPHSPWRYGTDARALLKGMWHAHLGWLFDRRQSNAERYAPDLLKDGGLRVPSRLFTLWAFLSLALPAAIGGLGRQGR